GAGLGRRILTRRRQGAERRRADGAEGRRVTRRLRRWHGDHGGGRADRIILFLLSHSLSPVRGRAELGGEGEKEERERGREKDEADRGVPGDEAGPRQDAAGRWWWAVCPWLQGAGSVVVFEHGHLGFVGGVVVGGFAAERVVAPPGTAGPVGAGDAVGVEVGEEVVEHGEPAGVVAGH